MWNILTIDSFVIITLDSFGFPHSNVVRALKEYLSMEGEAKRNIEIAMPKGVTAKGIPTQENYFDCGLYLLGYMKEFFKDPQSFVKKILMKEFDPDRDWAHLSPPDLRHEIRRVLQDQYSKQSGTGSTAKTDPIGPGLPGVNSASAAAIESSKSTDGKHSTHTEGFTLSCTVQGNMKQNRRGSPASVVQSPAKRMKTANQENTKETSIEPLPEGSSVLDLTGELGDVRSLHNDTSDTDEMLDNGTIEMPGTAQDPLLDGWAEQLILAATDELDGQLKPSQSAGSNMKPSIYFNSIPAAPDSTPTRPLGQPAPPTPPARPPTWERLID